RARPWASATPRPSGPRATSLRPPHPRHDERHLLKAQSAAGRAVAWFAVRRRGLKGQCAGVDAIAPAGGTGAVAEDMAQMTAAAAADHLGAAQQPGPVRP